MGPGRGPGPDPAAHSPRSQGGGGRRERRWAAREGKSSARRSPGGCDRLGQARRARHWQAVGRSGCGELKQSLLPRLRPACLASVPLARIRGSPPESKEEGRGRDPKHREGGSGSASRNSSPGRKVGHYLGAPRHPVSLGETCRGSRG